MQDTIFTARGYGGVPPPPLPYTQLVSGAESLQFWCFGFKNLIQNCNGILLIGGVGGGAVLPLSRHHCLYIFKCIEVLFGRTLELVDVSTMLETIF